MSWLSRLFGGKPATERKAQRLDYLNEALVLERQGDYDAALTSYRLALRDQPNDLKVLQNMAIAFSRVGSVEEAVRAYRRALEIDPTLSGAHYGLAFLLIKRGDAGGAEKHLLAFLLLKRGESEGATKHLQAFLAHPPSGDEADRWVHHAQTTLEQLKNPAGAAPPEHRNES